MKICEGLTPLKSCYGDSSSSYFDSISTESLRIPLLCSYSLLNHLEENTHVFTSGFYTDLFHLESWFALLRFFSFYGFSSFPLLHWLPWYHCLFLFTFLWKFRLPCLSAKRELQIHHHLLTSEPEVILISLPKIQPHTECCVLMATWSFSVHLSVYSFWMGKYEIKQM